MERTHDHSVIDKFRVLVSMGSEIEKIWNTSTNGFSVDFSNGDICNKETGQKFSSRVNYICYPNIEDQKHPVFKSYDNCFVEFDWFSQKACPQCLEE